MTYFLNCKLQTDFVPLTISDCVDVVLWKLTMEVGLKLSASLLARI